MDFQIYEPSPFSPKWYSHKHNGPGLRYEIAVEVQSGYIVWACGGFGAGVYRDDKLAQVKFTKRLQPNEMVIADKGCRQCKRFFAPKNGNKDNKLIKNILARHENVNRRVKSFDSMSGRFRHDLLLHNICFLAVVNIVQISIENGDALPEVSSIYKFN